MGSGACGASPKTFRVSQVKDCYFTERSLQLVILKRVCCAKDLPECFKLKCVSQAPRPTRESVW